MNTEQRILCLAARTHLDPCAEATLLKALDGPVDWERLWREALVHQVWPLLDLHLRRLRDRVAIPDPWLERSHRHLAGTFFENVILADQLLRVVRALEGAGAEVLPVKGVVLAESVYGNLGLRPAADIDVLVRRADLPSARTALRSLGFAQEPNPDFGHVHHALHDPPYFAQAAGLTVCVELHWRLWAPHLFPLEVDRLWDRAVLTQVRGASIRTLSPEDTLLHLVIHRSRTSLRLRLVCDVAELLRRHTATLDWAYILREAHRGAARTALYNSLMLAQGLLDAPLAPETLRQLRIGRIKRGLLDYTHGTRALFRPPGADGAARELSVAQRLIMLDDTGSVIRGLGYRLARGAKHVKFPNKQ